MDEIWAVLTVSDGFEDEGSLSEIGLKKAIRVGAKKAPFPTHTRAGDVKCCRAIRAGMFLKRERKERHMKTKILLFALASLLICLPVWSQSQPNVRAPGQTLTAFCVVHPMTDTMKVLAKEWEAKTGATLQINELPEEEFFKKMVIELSSGSPSFDICTLNHTNTVQYASSGWLEPIMPYLNDPNLTNKKAFDFGDFPASSLKAPTYKGVLYWMPVSYEVVVLWYRKDILKEMGLPVPRTMDELYQTAVKIKKQYPGMAGIVNRMQRGQGPMWPVSAYIADYKGTWIDKEGKVSMTDPNTYAAIDMYIKQLKDAGPDNPVNYGWYDVLNLFTQGKAGFMVDASTFLPTVFDKQKSKVWDKAAVAVIPAARDDGYIQTAGTTAWGLGITKASKNKQLAWDFIRWFTSPDTAVKVATQGGQVVRNSIWENPEFIKSYPYTDWRNACSDSIQKYTNDYYFPRYVQIGSILEKSDIALQNVMMGGDLMSEMKSLETQLRDIVNQN